MKGLLVFSSYVFTGAAASSASAVVDIRSKDSFDDLIAKAKEAGEHVLVQFYQPWDAACMEFRPAYEQASSDESLPANVKLAKCDATRVSEPAHKHGVRSFPSLKFFSDGDVHDYDGGKTADEISQWIKDMISDAVVPVDTMPEAEFPTVKYVFTGAEVSEAFTIAARRNRKVAQFFFLKNEEEEQAKILCIKSGEEPIESTASTSESIHTFVQESKIPLLGELKFETFMEYQAMQKGLVWVLLDHDKGEMLNAVANVRSDLEAVAKENTDFAFTYSDVHASAGPIQGILGISQFPAVVAQIKNENLDMTKTNQIAKTYLFAGKEVNQANLSAWFSDIKEGKVDRYIKTEPLPDRNNYEIRTVVGQNMESELGGDRDYLLLVYAPWCRTTSEFMPIFRNMASVFAMLDLNDHVRFGMMNGAANDSPVDSVEWSQFPTLFYVQGGGSRKAFKYEGELSEEGLISFMETTSQKEEIQNIRDTLPEEEDDAEPAPVDPQAEALARQLLASVEEARKSGGGDIASIMGDMGLGVPDAPPASASVSDSEDDADIEEVDSTAQNAEDSKEEL